MRSPLSSAHYLLLLMVTLCSLQVPAQDSTGAWDIPRAGGENIIEPSPEATAMRRYQDFPVSYANGTVDISIPLLDLPGGTTGVSLALSYQTGGIKRQDLQSIVGLGWNLTGLGSVSRQINGFPDEWLGRNLPVRFNMKDLPYDIDYLRSIIECNTETEYDRYSYNIPGYSGSFMIINNNIVQLPQTELIITRTPNSSNSLATESFTIATPDGLVYELSEQEHTSYTYIQHPTVAFQYDRCYENAITSWHLTRVSNTETIDYATYSYYPMQAWVRNNNTALTTYSYSIKNDMSLFDPRSENVGQDGSTNQTIFYDQRLPYEITTRSGKIRFELSMCHDGIRHEMPTDYIKSISLYDNNNNLIRKITFDNSQSFSDGRRMLREITAISDDTTVDKYSFTYIDDTAADGYDLFGYPNGRTMGASVSHSILNTRLELSDNRRPNNIWTSNNSLKTLTDISGITTTLNYEGSTVPVSGVLFNGNMQVGTRVRSISTHDPVTQRSRTRSFSYENPMCNINLGILTYADFISQSGTHYVDSYAQTYNYVLGVPYLASSRTRGYPVEQARIYYGKVTETISGTSIDKPVKTVYEYDLSHLLCPFITSEWNGFHQNTMLSIGAEYGKNLGNLDNTFSGQNDKDHKLLKLNTTRGYFKELIGAKPLLSKKTLFEWDGNDYQTRQVDEYTYLGKQSESIRTGIFCESVVFKFFDKWTSVMTDLNIVDLNDVFYFVTYLDARSDHPATHTINKFYPDGNSRSVTTAYTYCNDNLMNQRLPGFNTDSLKTTFSFCPIPVITKTSSGEESVTSYTARSENAVSSIILKSAVSHGFRHLPVAEKWILETNQGKDSLLRRYTYRQYESGGGNKLTRPSDVSIWTDSIIIFKQKYTEYDISGRITEMVDAKGRRISAKWMGNYDLLSEMSLPDVGLTTTYTYQPLVGCTSITAPSGRKRSFSYLAGRLVEKRNTAGDPVVSYSYQLYGDGSSATAANRFSTTVHDSQGSATDVTYYDGFGLPVQTVATVAGNNLVRSSVTYDALDRPVRQYLPVPADDASYNRNIQAAGQMHYDDTCPYAETRYRNMAGDAPLQVIREGEKMYGHTEKYEYLCNNTTDAMLRCRRYRLAGSSDSESITLDGDYPAGALDVTRVTDPDGCTLLTFTDWRGLRILERRVVSDSQFADTYYLYDVLGNVRVILQPEGAAQMTSTTKTWTPTDNVIDQFAFINRYDRRGNLTYAKVPGAGPVEMRYDPLNRLAMRRTPDLREYWNEYECFFYDPINRPLFSCVTVADRWGESGESIDPAEMWDDVPLMTAVFTSEAQYNKNTPWSNMYSFSDTRAAKLAYTSDTRSQNFYDDYIFINAYNSITSYFIPDSVSFNSNYGKGQLTATIRHKHGYDESDFNLKRLIGKPSFPDLYSVYGYDIEGRQILSCSTTPLPDIFTTTANTYSRQGYLTSSIETTGDNRMKSCTQYDTAGNILSFNTIVSNSEFSTATGQTYFYNTLGQLEATLCGQTNPLNSTYSYNLRGQMTGITTPVFAQTLKYEDGATPCYNDNISEMTVTYSGGVPIKRSYTYDGLNRLTAQTSTDGYNTAYTYNLNSSPLTVMRRGLTSNGTIGTVDDLDIVYSGNKLLSIIDAADHVILEGSLDLDLSRNPTHDTQISICYSYDSMGRVTRDPSQGISSITYHENNRPDVIKTSQNGTRYYEYDNDGNKLSVKTESYLSGLTGGSLSMVTRHAYCGSCEYDFMIFNNKRINSLTRINLPWGYIDANGKEYRYISDNQGNIRAVVDSTGTTVQTTDYYPYGLPMATSTGAAANPYKYSGKEFETGSGLCQYDFAARHYTTAVPLFNRPDDLAIKKPNISPYSYCNGDPINFVDPLGMDTINISFTDNKWTIEPPIMAEGDDVFIVKVGDKTETYTFSEGEYGKRVCALNLEIGENKSDATIGIYHISGNKNAHGYYVTPGGRASTENNSGRRIPDGAYPINAPEKWAQWRAPGVGGPVKQRGIRFHYYGDHNNYASARRWTDGCFVLSTNYRYNGGYYFDCEESVFAYIDFCDALGADMYFTYDFTVVKKGVNVWKHRIGAEFYNPINHILILQSRK